MVPSLLDVLLSLEARLQRRRHWMGLLILAMISVIACADARVWPGLSLALHLPKQPPARRACRHWKQPETNNELAVSAARAAPLTDRQKQDGGAA